MARRIRSPSNESRGHTRDDSIRRDVLCDHSTGADDTALANGDSGQQGCIGAYVSPPADPYGTNLQISLNYGHIHWNARMRRSQNFGARTPADEIFQDEVPGIKVALR